MKVVVPNAQEAQRLAAIGRAAFETDETIWTADDFLALAPPPRGIIVADRSLATALIALRLAADEAEVLTLAVVPRARRNGHARALLERAEADAAETGARRMFLEVAHDNTPARALYAGTGYVEVGCRARYYLRPDGHRADALILAKPLV